MTDWDDLRIFLGVVRGESLSAAGRALRLDPATVHRRIARLEETLGATLFTRSPQGHLLTEAGQRLVAHAEAAEQALSAAAEDLGGRPDRLSGQVRIGAPDGCANYLLPQILAEIAAAHPELELQVVALPRVFNLTRREADLAIAVSPPSGGRLTVQRLADYRLHLAAHRDYLACAGHPAAPADLARHRMIGYIPDMIFDKELDYLAEIGAPTVRLASNSVSVQLNWLRAGAGVGVVHDFALPAAPGVVRVLTGHVRLTRTFWLIRPEGDRRLDRLTRLAQLLTQGIRREIARLEAQVEAADA